MCLWNFTAKVMFMQIKWQSASLILIFNMKLLLQTTTHFILIFKELYALLYLVEMHISLLL